MADLPTIQIIFEIWTAVFSIAGALVVLATLRFDRKGAWSVVGLLLTNAIVNVSDAAAYYYRGNTTSTGYWMVRIANFGVFFFNIVLLFFITAYFTHIIRRNGGPKVKTPRYIAYGLIGLSALLLIFSRIFGFYYTFDENNLYHRLPSYWVMTVFFLADILVNIYLIIRYWKHFRIVERIEFLSFIILPLLALIVQTFVRGFSLTTHVNTVMILLVFLTYELGYSHYMASKERAALNQIISAFVATVDEKDPYTGGHSARVAKYSVMIAKRLELRQNQVDEIFRMALLHDIGKIGIPDAIINKPGKLTPEEYQIIQTHPERGYQILQRITENPRLSIGAKWHHERYDGQGYPDGLAGEDIPLEARIIGMADAYDAMTSNRSYRPYLAQEAVKEEIRNNLGKQFDPRIGETMLSIIQDDREYQLREADKGVQTN